MPEFDFSFTCISRKKQFVAALWMYYIYIYAPRIVRNIFMTVLCLVFGTMALSPDNHIFLFFAGVMLLVTLAEFPVYCRRMLEVTTPLGVFDKESHLHFYSDRMVCRCGENESTTTYSSFTGYFQFGGVLVLMMGKNLFSSCFGVERFEGRLPELTACLDAAGVKKVKFFTVRRWLFTVIALAGLLAIAFI